MRAGFHKDKLNLKLVVIFGFAAILLVVAIITLVSLTQSKKPQSQAKLPVDQGPFCKIGEDEKATAGIFCSEAFGFKLSVPGLIQGKLNPATSEKSSIQPGQPSVAALGSFTAGETYAGNPDVNYSVEVSEYPVQASLQISSNATYDPTTKTVTDQGVEARSATVDGTKIYGIGRRNAAAIDGSLVFVRHDRLFLLQYRTQSVLGSSDPGIRQFNQDVTPLLTFYGSSPEVAVIQSSLRFKD